MFGLNFLGIEIWFYDSFEYFYYRPATSLSQPPNSNSNPSRRRQRSAAGNIFINRLKLKSYETNNYAYSLRRLGAGAGYGS
jgi:hypothetical protein